MITLIDPHFAGPGHTLRNIVYKIIYIYICVCDIKMTIIYIYICDI